MLLCTANFAFAVNSVEASNIPAMKTIAVKFVLAMLGVAFFSILIFVRGLSLYNRFSFQEKLKILIFAEIL